MIFVFVVKFDQTTGSVLNFNNPQPFPKNGGKVWITENSWVLTFRFIFVFFAGRMPLNIYMRNSTVPFVGFGSSLDETIKNNELKFGKGHLSPSLSIFFHLLIIILPKKPSCCYKIMSSPQNSFSRNEKELWSLNLYQSWKGHQW